MKVTIAINALIDKEFTIDDKFKLLTKEPKTKNKMKNMNSIKRNWLTPRTYS